MFQERGFTLIEVLVALGLVVMLFGGVYLVYYSVIDSTENSEYRSMAAVILNNQVEIVRNLPFDQVGTVGGVPAGVLPQTKVVTSTTGTVFQIATTVRNIDDPFDGTLGGTPNDTSPADYKLVELTISCTSCVHFTPLSLTARVAPKNLENSLSSGSLFVTAIDAGGVVIPEATVRIINSSTSPAIDLTDITNQQGVLQLVGAPTSTQRYQIIVTKPGYSTDQNYLPGAPGNPNPASAFATVLAQTLTQTTFQIDKVSTLTILSSDATCVATGSQPFSLALTKAIGSNPTVLKFSLTTSTDASGRWASSSIEWGSYTATSTGAADVLGAIPTSPFSIAPNASATLRFVLTPAEPRSLLITVKDATSGAAVPSSTVQLTKAGFSKVQVTGHALRSETNWAGGNYSSQSGTSVTSPVGSITMASSGGFYSTSTTAWLISTTMDFGAATTTFHSFAWNGSANGAGANSIRFQIAANNDTATWNFVGPDGTALSYFTAATSSLGVQFNNNRYLRYKVYLTTQNETVTPHVDDVTVEFAGPCSPASTLFQNLASGTYTIAVTAPGYSLATSSISVSSNFQQATITVSP